MNYRLEEKKTLADTGSFHCCQMNNFQENKKKADSKLYKCLGELAICAMYLI